jgi:hypothetical protein
MKKKKINFIRIIGMIPWLFLMVLYFIWANQNGFSISKNAFGALLVPGTGILWGAIVFTFADAATENID